MEVQGGGPEIWHCAFCTHHGKGITQKHPQPHEQEQDNFMQLSHICKPCTECFRMAVGFMDFQFQTFQMANCEQIYWLSIVGKM